MPSEKMPLTVKTTMVKVVGWIAIIFFVFCAVASYAAGQANVSPLFLLFVALGIYLILISGELSMDLETITYTTPLAKYRMMWDEVGQVETDTRRASLVFYSKDGTKCLAVFGTQYWSASNGASLLQLLLSELEKRKIQLKVTTRAAFSSSKNTRVK